MSAQGWIVLLIVAGVAIWMSCRLFRGGKKGGGCCGGGEDCRSKKKKP